MTLFGEEEELDHFLVEEHLGERGVALYTSMHRDEGTFHAIMAEAVKKGDSIGINGRDYTIYPGLCYDNIVADRAITIYLALIVPDELYGKLAREPEAYCRNVHLADEVTDKLGLMQAIQKMEPELAGTGIEYDSFLAGIGRNLFYTVSASYLTVYLGVLFLLIANTVISQIISNAVKYADSREGRILFSMEQQEDQICLGIYNNGDGVPAEDVPFESGFGVEVVFNI